MIIPRYWARSENQHVREGSRQINLECWGWSTQSMEDALRVANDRRQKAIERWKAGKDPDRYGYDTRPQREEIILQVEEDEQGNPLTVITRNAYGVLVLNCARVMFIDVDIPEVSVTKKLGGLIKRLFGSSQPAEPSPEEKVLYTIRQWSEAKAPELAIRVYRTCAGFRCLVTNQLMEATDARTTQLLKDCQSDPLYIRLCKSQACFRARLTPKPWRCGLVAMPHHYPLETPEQGPRRQKWIEKYEQVIGPYAVCKLVEELGPRGVLPEIQPVLDLHDQFTRVGHDLPLK